MKKRVIPLLILWMLLLNSCGRPEETTVTMEVPAVTTTEADTRTTASTPASFACDAVFFGDSITCDGNFDQLFPGLRIVNLGVYGDTIEDLLSRVPEVRAENPAKIFLLGGINALRPDNGAECLSQYTCLLDALRDACPNAEIIVQSVLPVAAELDQDGLENEVVRRFNAALAPLAGEKGCAFADLYAAYEADGALNPTLTRDGLHLNFTAYGPWAEVIAKYLNK